MSGEGQIALKWRIVVSIIGTFILLALLGKMDDLYVAISLFVILIGTITVATKLAGSDTSL